MNFYSERGNYNPSSLSKKYNKHDTLEDIKHDPNRDISPYRVENFIDMLHNFGISDSMIKRKLVNSPNRYHKFPNEQSSDSYKDTSVIRNVSFMFFNFKYREKQDYPQLSHLMRTRKI